MWIVIAAVVLVLGLLARPLIAIHRSSVPSVVRTVDVAAADTAFDPDDRHALVARGFGDEGVTVIDIAGTEVLLHLFRRADDGSVVTGLSSLSGGRPSHYVTTMLGDGRGWVDTRRTDRTPGPPGEFVQVSPGTSLVELLADHDRALTAVVELGARPATTFDAFGVHLQQGRLTRASLYRHPIRWLVGLARHTRRPDTRRDLAHRPDLEKRLRAVGLV